MNAPVEHEYDQAPRSRTRLWVVSAGGRRPPARLGRRGLPATLVGTSDRRSGRRQHAQGIGVGLFYGFAFTVLPLALLWWGMRRASRWKTRFLVVAAALVLAVPNLLTLGIVLGRGNAAHAGDRTLDVEAPGFRGATLAGAIVAVVALIALIGLLRSRKRARLHARRLEAELQARGEAPGSPPR